MKFRNAALPIALMVLLSGCSGYHTACTSLSDLSPDRNSEFSSSCDLAAGDEIRVILRDGRRLEGSLVQVSPTGILVEANADSLVTLEISGDQIASIEKRSDVSGVGVLGGGILVGLVAAVFVGIANWSM